MPRLIGNFMIFVHALILAVILPTISCASSDVSEVAILILEPANNDIGYTASRGGAKAGTYESILKELMRNYSRGDKLALLFHPDVPVRAITTVRSLANKVGFTIDEMRLFSFDKKRKGMIEVKLGNKFVRYSIDLNEIDSYFTEMPRSDK